MTGHAEGSPVVGDPLGAQADPIEIAAWVRFVWSAAGTALEAALDLGEAASVPGAPERARFVGRSRLLGLVPGETKLVTFDGVVGEVSMEPDPLTVRSSTSGSTNTIHLMNDLRPSAMN